MPKKDAAFSVSAQVSQCVFFINPFSHSWIIYTNYSYGPIQLYQATLLFIIEFTYVIHYLWNVNYQTDTVWTCMKKNPKERRKLAAECVWPVDNERVTKSCQSHSRAQAIFTVCSTKNVRNFSIFRQFFAFFLSLASLFFLSLGLSPTFIYTHKLPFFFEPKISDHLYTPGPHIMWIHLVQRSKVMYLVKIHLVGNFY